MILTLLGMASWSQSDPLTARIPGEAGISPFGEATYSLPFDLPSGANGLTPRLSLQYSHRINGGLFGVGWTLGGLSRIERCAHTFSQDNAAREVKLDVEDRFCFDGNKLRRVGTGVYWADNAQYRAELDNYTRFTAFTATTPVASWFRAESKDGLIYEYGRTVDSRRLAPGTSIPFAWLVNRISDRSGNYITITYSPAGNDGTAEANPVEILYAGNSGRPAPYKVAFEYSGQQEKASTRWIGGGQVTVRARMWKITVTQGTQPVTQYTFEYEFSPTTARDRLIAVHRSGATSTQFRYRDGAQGWNGASAGVTGIAAPAYALSIDINEDGLEDLVYSTHATSGSGYWAYRLANLSSASGFDAQVTTSNRNFYYDRAIPGDAEGDGDIDIFVPCETDGNWCVMVHSEVSGLSRLFTTDLRGDGWFADVDGDGRDDWVRTLKSTLSDPHPSVITVRLQTGIRQWAPSVDYWQDGNVEVDVFAPTPFGTYVNWWRSRVRKADFNDDRRADLLLEVNRLPGSTGSGWAAWASDTAPNGAPIYRHIANIPSSASGARPLLLDVDADGKSDLLSFVGAAGNTEIRYGTTSGLSAPRPGPSLANMDLSSIIIVDWDGDGRGDVLSRSTAGTWHVSMSYGSNFGFPVATSLPGSGNSATTRNSDANGDGLADISYAVGSTLYTHLHAGVLPDLLRSANDGFGNLVTLEYSPLSNPAIYEKYIEDEAYSQYPRIGYSGSMHVVSKMIRRTRPGAVETRSFRYVGGIVDLRGRGFQGFDHRTTVLTFGEALSNDLRLLDRFGQEFPNVGRPLGHGVYTNNPYRPITGVNYEYAAISEGSGTQRYTFSYPSVTRRFDYEHTTSSNSGPFRASTQTVTMTADSYGTPTSVRRQVDERTTANGLYPSAVVTEEIVNSDWLNDTGSWCVGRPRSTTTTSSHTVMPAGDPISRTQARDWDGLCRPSVETVAPNTPMALTSSFTYDSYGNVDSITVSGLNAAQAQESRQTLLEWDPAGSYGPAGQFLTKVTNPLGHVTQYRWRASLGLPSQYIDANGLATLWEYDSLGRRLRETRPDGTRSEWTYLPCDEIQCQVGDPDEVDPAAYQLRTVHLDTTGSVVLGEQLQMFDRFEREVLTSQRMLGGGFSNVITHYDGRGQVSGVSMPHWTGGARYYATYTYDAAGRLTQVRHPVSDTDSTLQTISITHNGLTQQTTDPEGKATTLVRDVLDRIVLSGNHLAQATTYIHDAAGNLRQTRDPAGNGIVIGYDPARGFKTSMSDPDAGLWRFAHSAFGELRSQTDAKNQPIEFRYDKLSRLTQRIAPDLAAHWNWDGTAIGKLDRYIWDNGARYKAFRYDALARPSTEELCLDECFLFTHEYSATTGLLQHLTYPRVARSARALKLTYEYEYGQVQRVRDQRNPNVVYWEAAATDAFGHLIDQRYGNGLYVNSTFDQVTGLPARIDSGFNGGSVQQQLQYTWDKVGNLKRREDLNQGTLREDFFYDGAYRLDYVQRNGVTTLDLGYDAIGNLTSKSDVGSLVYAGAQAGCSYYSHTQPHAVRNAAGTTYCYDANGNMVMRGGQSITWYSSNLPRKINYAGGRSAEFWYDPDGQRYKQVHHAWTSPNANPRTTYYAGGLFEKAIDTSAAGTQNIFRHYIFAGGKPVASYVLDQWIPVGGGPVAEVASTSYLTYDHLGSVDSLYYTDTAVDPAPTARFSNDAFGQRRDRDWDGPAASADITEAWYAISNRGFTGHEHLDNVGDLIHMNGRVYDPRLGRFLSADPFVPEPYNLQSLNRYSYVYNNPLSYIDPSGYDPTGCIWCASAIATAASWIGGLLGSNDPPPTPPLWHYTPGTPDAPPPQASVADRVQSTVSGTTNGTKILDTLTAPWGGWDDFKYAVRCTWECDMPGNGSLEANLAGLPPILGGVIRAPNLLRPLQASDFGVKSLKALEGSLRVDGSLATVTIRNIEGNLGHYMDALNKLRDTARATGATTLRLEGTVANPTLLKALERVLGPAQRGMPGGAQDYWLITL